MRCRRFGRFAGTLSVFAFGLGIKVSDKFDQLIIKALQQDARQPVSAIAEQVNLSRSAVSERLKRLEQSGEIVGYQVEIGRASCRETV